MTHILLISPKLEIVVHNIPIFDNNDVRKVQTFIKNKEEQYGELERIIISMGTVRIMEKADVIPVPLQWGGAACPHQSND